MYLVIYTNYYWNYWKDGKRQEEELSQDYSLQTQIKITEFSELGEIHKDQGIQLLSEWPIKEIEHTTLALLALCFNQLS